MSQVTSLKSPSKAEIAHKVNMSTLNRIDLQIMDIVDKCTNATLYEYDINKNDIVKRNCEGILFLVKRSVEPFYGLVLLNRLGPENFTATLHPRVKFNQYSSGGDKQMMIFQDGVRIYGLYIQELQECTKLFDYLKLFCLYDQSLEPQLLQHGLQSFGTTVEAEQYLKDLIMRPSSDQVQDQQQQQQQQLQQKQSSSAQEDASTMLMNMIRPKSAIVESTSASSSSQQNGSDFLLPETPRRRKKTSSSADQPIYVEQQQQQQQLQQLKQQSSSTIQLPEQLFAELNQVQVLSGNASTKATTISTPKPKKLSNIPSSVLKASASKLSPKTSVSEFKSAGSAPPQPLFKEQFVSKMIEILSQDSEYAEKLFTAYLTEWQKQSKPD
ncbi:hypothetical protein MIR68_010175 [Amoeboaphelidium protococcarum]|nr:hypothetical protein MIR68_010175 [Amoeboaphelidium protococcarum]